MDVPALGEVQADGTREILQSNDMMNRTTLVVLIGTTCNALVTEYAAQAAATHLLRKLRIELGQN